MWSSDLLYAAQFAAVRAFLSRLTDDDLAAESTLPGWTVADLVAHLQSTAGSIAALEEVHDADIPIANTSALTVAEYLSAYASGADDIAAIARESAARSNGDLRVELDEAQRLAMARLDDLGAVDRIVRARRGPILLSAFMDTRVIEMVVHAGDLRRSVPTVSPPRVLGSARRRVVTLLRDVLAERAQDPPAALSAAADLSEVHFIDLAAGRVPVGPELPHALAQALPLF